MSSIPPDFDHEKMKSRKYKAEDFNVNQELQHGPLKDRKCTDVCCCLIFVIFLSTLLGMGIYGYSNGEVAKLLAPSDSMGNICGFNLTKDYPQLYETDIDFTIG